MQTTTSQQIANIAAFTGMRNPMERDDYRQAIRSAMLVDAKYRLLTDLGCPAMHADRLSTQPMSAVKERLALVAARRAAK